MNKSPQSITTLQEKMRESFDDAFLGHKIVAKEEHRRMIDFLDIIFSQAISTAYEQGVKDGKEAVEFEDCECCWDCGTDKCHCHPDRKVTHSH